MGAAASAALLVVVLVVAAVRPRGLPEAVAAVPAAGVVVATGLLPLPAAQSEVSALGPTVGFLAAILLLGRLADAEGSSTGSAPDWARARTDGPSGCWGWCSSRRRRRRSSSAWTRPSCC
ncbi:hypothetical protein ACFQV8_21125 [Pseudonocardia benzenivorans]